MATSFAEVKKYLLVVLYDYMLTSDEETFWYSIPNLREALPAEISGAFVRRAIDALAANGDIQIGSSDGIARDIFALTNDGIEAAEKVISERGVELSSYSPAPEVDRIISSVFDGELHAEISGGLTEIAREIRESNQVSVDLGDFKDLVESETEAAVALARQPRFRAARLAGLIVPTLRYLADKFVGQAIGELAKQLADLLIKIH